MDDLFRAGASTGGHRGARGFGSRDDTVTPETIRPTATVWGNLRAAENWVAVSRVQGEVVWRHPDLEPGRLIAAGTEVLRIDPADYEPALAQAEADLERTRTLAAQGSVPQVRADEAERATLLSRRTVVELENSIALIAPRQARLAAQVSRTQAAINRARRALDHTTLKTPFNLRVTEVAAERFQTVAPGQIVIRGDGISAVEVVAHLPIEAFRRLIGDRPPDVPLVEMMRQGPAAGIEVTLSPLSGAPVSGALVIPEAALHGGTLRISNPENRLELRPVTAAFALDGRIVISQGLAAGDRVVLDDIAPAIPGLALDPVEAAR